MSRVAVTDPSILHRSSSDFPGLTQRQVSKQRAGYAILINNRDSGAENL